MIPLRLGSMKRSGRDGPPVSRDALLQPGTADPQSVLVAAPGHEVVPPFGYLRRSSSRRGPEPMAPQTAALIGRAPFRPMSRIGAGLTDPTSRCEISPETVVRLPYLRSC